MATEKILFELNIDENGAVLGLEKVDKGVKNVGESTKKTTSGLKKFGTTLKNLGKAAGIIGLISAAIGILQEAFRNNQKVMDVFSNVTTALGIVVNDLFNFILDNSGEVVGFFKDIFENPLENIKALGEAIKNNIIERFESFLDTLGFLSDAIIKVFKGDFQGAMDSAKLAGKEYVDVLTGVDGTFDKVTEGVGELIDATVEYTKETYNSAAAITAAEKSLVTLENTQTRVREKADRDAERQRQIRDDYTKGIDERIEANIKLGEILEQQQKDELAAVDAQINAISLRLALDKNNQELQNQIYALNTERFAVEAQQEGFRSEQQINAINLDKEKLELLGFQTQAELDSYLEIAAANKVLSDEKKANAKEVLDAEKKAITDRVKAEGIAKNNSIANASEVLSAVSAFAGEGTEAAKGLAIGQVAIDVAKGLVGTLAGWSSLGPWGIAGAVAGSVAILASGAAAIRNITSVKPGTKPVTQTANTPSTSAANVAPPTFQTQSDTGLNQLGDTIGDAINSNPVQAWVSSSDVSTAQQFDRLTENNTTL